MVMVKIIKLSLMECIVVNNITENSFLVDVVKVVVPLSKIYRYGWQLP